jgi:hypothetical protein
LSLFTPKTVTVSYCHVAFPGLLCLSIDLHRSGYIGPSR